jgi:hypothetical protein
VYVDLCASANPPPGPISVTIRQTGAVKYTMAQQLYLGPGSSYYLYRYGIPSGTYDVLVTVSIDGHTAVARDLSFTIS